MAEETLNPGTTVRAIDYEIVPKSQVEKLGVSHAAAASLGTRNEVAVLRCVDGDGEKLTAVGDAKRLRELLASGEAGDPAGMKLVSKEFPLVLPGWRKAS